MDVFEPGVGLSRAELEVLADWSESTLQFGIDVFPKTVRSDRLSAARREHFALLDDDTIPQLYVCAYRGFMKTTSVWLYCVRQLLFRRVKFLLYVSRSQEYAEAITEGMKQAILCTPIIRRFFGNLKPLNYDGDDPRFSKRSWYLQDPSSGKVIAFVAPKGSDQQINGAWILIDNQVVRPTLIVVDDGEDRRRVHSEQQRERYRDFLYGALFPCVSEELPDAETNRWRLKPGEYPPHRKIYQDTIKHPQCEMAAIMESPMWTGRVFPKAKYVDGRIVSTAPELFSDEQLQKEFNESIRRGYVDTWARENMCVKRFHGGSNFTERDFQYYDEEETDLNSPRFERFMIVDPARTSNPKSAYTAAVPFAFDSDRCRILVRPSLMRRLDIEKRGYRVLELAVETNTQDIYVEITGGADETRKLFRDAACDMGIDDWVNFIFFDAQDIFRGGSDDDFGDGKYRAKRRRLSFALRLYKQRHIWHCRDMRGGSLEKSLLNYPDCEVWDGVDCIGHLPRVLNWRGTTIVSRYEPDNIVRIPDHIRKKSSDWDEFMRERRWEYSPIAF